MKTHMSARQAAARSAEILSSFLRLTEFAAGHKVRAVIIAGDLFDSEFVKKRTVDAVLDAIRRTPEVDYLYLPGNHDEAARAFCDETLPENFKKFGAQWKTFCYGETAISGVRLGSGEEDIYRALPQTGKAVQIVTLHGQVGSSCGEDLIDLNLLKNRGISYLALGHIHSYSRQKLDETGVFCYSGCLEGRGFDECGEKGFVLLDVENGKITSEFIPFACRTLHRVEADVSGCMKNAEIAAKMKEAAKNILPDDMVRFVLTGSISPEADVSASYLADFFSGSFFFSAVKDETTLELDPEAYRNEVSLKGEFIRQVLAGELSEQDKAAVIRAGLQALAGEEITL